MLLKIFPRYGIGSWSIESEFFYIKIIRERRFPKPILSSRWKKSFYIRRARRDIFCFIISFSLLPWTQWEKTGSQEEKTGCEIPQPDPIPKTAYGMLSVETEFWKTSKVFRGNTRTVQYIVVSFFVGANNAARIWSTIVHSIFLLSCLIPHFFPPCESN